MAESTAEVPAEDRAIGERVRMVRRRRGLSVETAAGLAGRHRQVRFGVA
ncbi:MAG TPA: hypothetical protein VK735_31900 [Pseudonocardia sp.]|nr:hypothetical protein [Pseudonocardia sp.]HTF52072.1 hypothetical protein [Pseudonocardia sp.]